MWPAKAYGIIVFIAFMMCVVTFGFGKYFAEQDAKQIFCDITNATLAVQAPKPTDPALHPGREQQYLMHQKFLVLKREHHCGDRVS